MQLPPDTSLPARVLAMERELADLRRAMSTLYQEDGTPVPTRQVAAAPAVAAAAQETATGAAETAGEAQEAAGAAQETAAGAAETAGTAQTTALAAQLLGAINRNPVFSAWTGTYPDGWAVWSGASAPTKETTLARTPPNAARWNVTSATATAGMTASGGGALADLPLNVEYVAVEVDFLLTSGTLAGAGVLLDWSGMTGGNRDTLSLAAEVPSPQLNKVHRVTKVLRRPQTASGTQNGWAAYLVANLSSMAGGGAVKNIVIDRVGFRPATAEEVSAYRVRSFAADNIEGNTVTGALVQTAKASPQPATRMAMDGASGLVAQTAGKTMFQVTPGGKLTALDATIIGGVRTAETGPRVVLEQQWVTQVIPGQPQTERQEGFLRFYTGNSNNDPAEVNARGIYNQDGTVMLGSRFRVKGVNATADAPELNMDVVEKAAGGWEGVANIKADRFTVNGHSPGRWVEVYSAANYSANIPLQGTFALLPGQFVNGIAVPAGALLEVEWDAPRLQLAASTGVQLRLVAVPSTNTSAITVLDADDYSVTSSTWMPGRLAGQILSGGGSYNVAVEGKCAVAQSVVSSANLVGLRLRYRIWG